MGQINVEGLGIVEIAGERPTAEEKSAIANRLRVAPRDPVIRKHLRSVPPPGPSVVDEFGMVPKDVRAGIRESVEEIGGVAQFGIEMTPSLLGTGIGMVVGSPFGPPGIIGFGALGGGIGEFLGQDFGVAPESDLGIVLGFAGPLTGGAVGGVLKGGRQIASKAFAALPPVSAARFRQAATKAMDELESVGTKILANQKGIMGRTASQIYKVARESGVVVPSSVFGRTRTELKKLLEELDLVRMFPEGEQAAKIVERTLEIFSENPTISFDTIITARSLLGRTIGRAEKAAGVTLHSAKTAFKSLVQDIDDLAAGAVVRGPRGRFTKLKRAERPAQLSKLAAARAKLEFSVRELEEGVARFAKDLPGGGVEVNIRGMQKWLRDIVNPKSAKFNKNFTDALVDELPAIQSRLAELSKAAAGSRSPGGPGSIVVRGIGARAGRSLVGAVTGGLLGAGAGGPVGAAIGGLAGASLPEMLTGLLMTKGGAAFLERGIRLGKGEISARYWALGAQILAQSSIKGPSEARADSDLLPKARRVKSPQLTGGLGL